MPANISQQEIMDRLARIKGRSPVAPKDYQEFMPAKLTTKPFDDSQRYDLMEGIHQRSVNETNIVREQARQKKIKDELARLQAERDRARQAYKSIKAAQPSYTGGSYTYESIPGMKVGANNITTVNWQGHTFSVNKYAAPRFTGFLNELAQMGYKPVSIGGYRPGSTIQTGPSAGKGIPDLHSMGLAIDIDPGKNPVYGSGGGKYALPPNVGALAAKYGLSWGGNWKSYKDYMHFSVPYGGRQ